MSGDVLERVDRTCQLVYSVGGRPHQVARHYLDIVALYERTRGLLTGVRQLLEHGLPNEAIVLCRPLLTDSLALAELAAADEERRAKLVIGWDLHTLARLRVPVSSVRASWCWAHRPARLPHRSGPGPVPVGMTNGESETR